MISARTQTLIDRLPKDHPLSPAMRDAMIAALAASEGFSGHKIALASDRRMTDVGRREALKEALTQNYGKQWVKAKAPIAKARSEIASRRAALTVKPVDPANLAAAIERQEIRAWIRGLDQGVRQSVVASSSDRRILEAALSAPPQLSGIVDPKAAAEIESRYFEVVFPSELASIEALDSVVAEAEMALAVARNEMRAVIDVDMHARDFDELMKPVEIIRPWLIDDGKQVCEIDSAGKPSYRVANDSDRALGVQYENFEAFKAAQGLAA